MIQLMLFHPKIRKMPIKKGKKRLLMELRLSMSNFLIRDF